MTSSTGPLPWDVPTTTPPDEQAVAEDLRDTSVAPADRDGSGEPVGYSEDEEATAIDGDLVVDETTGEILDATPPPNPVEPKGDLDETPVAGDAVIVCDCETSSQDDEVHAWDPDTGCPPLTPTATDEVVLSASVLDVKSIDEILDGLREEGLRRSTVLTMRDTILDRVRFRADERRKARVERLAGEDPTSSTDLRGEIVGASDDADVLSDLAGAFTAGAKEAKGVAGDLLDELPGRGGKPRRSTKVADGQGWEVSVSKTPNERLSVDTDAVVGVLIPYLIGHADTDDGLDPATAFAKGARLAIDLFRSVLATSPGYRSTALDALVRKLEDAGEDDLAKRLAKAYGKKATGEPTVKVDRKPIESKGGDQ